MIAIPVPLFRSRRSSIREPSPLASDKWASRVPFTRPLRPAHSALGSRVIWITTATTKPYANCARPSDDTPALETMLMMLPLSYAGIRRPVG